MKSYLSLFRIKFIAGLQYRVAALSGCVTQFFWGMMTITLYKVFYVSNPGAFPMEFGAFVTYIWLQQMTLSLIHFWVLDNDIINFITEGNVGYELCRPIRIYPMWFIRNLANRTSKAVLKCWPILLGVLFLPVTYRFTAPKNIGIFALFILSLCMTTLIIVACTMLIYISNFYTLSPLGVRIVIMTTMEFLSGLVIPLPFFPEKIRIILELLPFGSMQNIPFRIYSGDISGNDIGLRLGLQLFWLLVIILIGECLMKKALRRVVVQGG